MGQCCTVSSETQAIYSRGSLLGYDHEFLESQASTGMRSSIENVHERNRQNIRLLCACEIRHMGIEWHSLGRKHPSAIEDRNPSPRSFTFSAAPAFAIAKLTPRTALAPRLVLFVVPSSFFRNSSTFAWSLTSRFSLMTAGPMTSLTFLTAFETPFPPHFDLSPSRSSQASCCPDSTLRQRCHIIPKIECTLPVEAPDGTIARWRPRSVTTSTSTVGFPRES